MIDTTFIEAELSRAEAKCAESKQDLKEIRELWNERKRTHQLDMEIAMKVKADMCAELKYWQQELTRLRTELEQLNSRNEA